MATMELAKGNESYDPLETSRNVFDRQLRVKPPREKHVFSLDLMAEYGLTRTSVAVA